MARLESKYDRRSLTFFLMDPLRIRPSGRMPRLKLSTEESADLAAYLLHKNVVPSGDTELPDKREDLANIIITPGREGL